MEEGGRPGRAVGAEGAGLSGSGRSPFRSNAEESGDEPATSERERGLPDGGERAAFLVVAKSPIARLAAWAHERGWDPLRFRSTAGDTVDPLPGLLDMTPGGRGNFFPKPGS